MRLALFTDARMRRIARGDAEERGWDAVCSSLLGRYLTPSCPPRAG